MRKILDDIKALKALPPEKKVETARLIIQQCCTLPDLELNEVRKALKAVGISKKSVDQELRKAKNRNKNSATQGASNDINILHGAIDFTDHSVVLGFRVREVADDGSVVQKLQCLFKGTYGWEVKSGPNLTLTAYGKRYAVDPTSCPP